MLKPAHERDLDTRRVVMERATAKPENISRTIYELASYYMMPPATKVDIDDYLTKHGYPTFRQDILDRWEDDP